MTRQVFRSISCSLLGLAVILGLTGTAGAAWKENSFEVGIYSPYVSFDNNTLLDNDFGYGVRFGYKFVKGHEVEVGWNRVSTKADLGSLGKFDVDVSTTYVGYLYNWTKPKSVTPFVTAGIGSTKFDLGGGFNDTNSSYYGGGGVRFYFTDNFNLRVEGD